MVDGMGHQIVLRHHAFFMAVKGAIPLRLKQGTFSAFFLLLFEKSTMITPLRFIKLKDMFIPGLRKARNGFRYSYDLIGKYVGIVHTAVAVVVWGISCPPQTKGSP